MLLYAFKVPTFVVDAYTRRIFSNLGLVNRDADYDDVKGFFEKSMGRDLVVYQEYHALLVEHAKRFYGRGSDFRLCPVYKDVLKIKNIKNPFSFSDFMIIGVVGKANVGKSTFFKACTLSDVVIANYPFAAIKPNSGVGFIRVDCADKFFNVQCNPRHGFCINNQRFVPVEMIDVAGLVPGAHEGKGMGLEFLNDLNQADALIL